MKLIDILPHIDSELIRVKVYGRPYINSNDYEVYFEGSLSDIPWWVANMYIDTDDDGAGIGIAPPSKNKYGVIVNNLNIYVRERRV